jgi:hypothetical protein
MAALADVLQQVSSGAAASASEQMSGPFPVPENEFSSYYEEFLRLRERATFEIRFNELLLEWKSTRPASSSSTVIAMQPAYQQIIGMGAPVVPFILRELSRELDHWFWALKAITGQDPVSPEHRGRMRDMAADWLRWGREKGYAR